MEEIIYKKDQAYVALITAEGINTKGLSYELVHNLDYKECTEITIDRSSEESIRNSLSTLSFYILPVSNDIMSAYNTTYSAMQKDVDIIQNDKESITSIIPINVKEMTNTEWNDMLQNIETSNLHYCQLLDYTRSNHQKTSTPFHTLLQEALDENDNEEQQKALEYQNAFPYKIFISYRQKDRLLACALMRRIHQDPYFRNIGFWYDQDIVAGKDFSKQIFNEMENADLILMLVTDNLIESYEQVQEDGSTIRGNYVSLHEYPAMGKKANQKVIPIAYDMEDACSDKKNQFSDSNNTITFFNKANENRYYEMFPRKQGVHALVYSYNDLSELIYEYLKDKPEYSTPTPRQQYYIGLAYKEGYRTEADLDTAALKFLELKNSNTGKYSILAREQLISITKQKYDELGSKKHLNQYKNLIEEDYTYWSNVLSKYDNQKSTWNRKPKDTTSRKAQDWYHSIKLPRDHFGNVIIDRNIETDENDEYSIKLPETETPNNFNIFEIVRSMLERIKSIEKVLDYLDVQTEQLDENNRIEETEFKIIMKNINAHINAALSELLYLRMGITDPEEQENISQSTVKGEDFKEHKVYACVFKKIYDNIEIGINGESSNSLSAIWICLKKLQLRSLMKSSDNSIQEDYEDNDKDDIIRYTGLKIFNILSMIDILLSSFKSSSSNNKSYTEIANIDCFANGIDQFILSDEENTVIYTDTYKTVKQLCAGDYEYNRNILLGDLNMELSKISDTNLKKAIQLNIVKMNISEDKESRNEDEFQDIYLYDSKNEEDIDEKEKIIRKRQKAFRDKIRNNITTYSLDSYNAYEKACTQKALPETLMKEAESANQFVQSFSDNQKQEFQDIILEMEHIAWAAYNKTARTEKSKEFAHRYMNILKSCTEELTTNTTTGEYRNKLIHNSRQHLSKFIFLCNRKELKELYQMLQNFDKEKYSSIIEQIQIIENVNKEYHNNQNWLYAKRHTLRLATTRSGMVSDKTAEELAQTISFMLAPSKKTTDSTIHERDYQELDGFITDYEAFKKLRYCMSVLICSKKNNDTEKDLIEKLFTTYKAYNDKWACYVEKCQSVRNKIEDIGKSNNLEDSLNCFFINSHIYENEFRTRFWDNNDAGILISYIYDLLGELYTPHFNSNTVTGNIYRRFIVNYYVPYIQANYDNRLEFKRYLDSKITELNRLNVTLEDQETQKNKIIKSSRTYYMMLYYMIDIFKNSSDIERTQLKYYLFLAKKILKRKTNDNLPWPIEKDDDLKELECIYKLEFEIQTFDEIDSVDILVNAYQSKFLSENLHHKIVDYITNLPLYESNDYSADGPLGIFWAFEDIAPELCMRCYKKVKSNNNKIHRLLNNNTDNINFLKEQIIEDAWNNEFTLNLQKTDTPFIEIINLYPAVALNTIYRVLIENEDTYKQAFRYKSFLTIFQASSLEDIMKSLMHTVQALLNVINVLDVPCIQKNCLKIIDAICEGLKDYFPVMSPLDRDIWISAQDSMNRISEKNEYSDLSERINRIIDNWYIIYNILKTGNSNLNDINTITLIGESRQTERLYKYFCDIHSATSELTETDPKYLPTYLYPFWRTFLTSTDKDIVKQFDPYQSDYAISYARKKNVLYKSYLLNDEDNQQMKNYSFAYDALSSIGHDRIFRNYLQTWLPVIRKEKDIENLNIPYATEISNDIEKILEDTISASIFMDVWEPSGLLDKINTSKNDTKDYQKMKKDKAKYYEYLANLKKLNWIRHEITVGSFDNKTVKNIWQSDKIKISDNDLETFYPDPADNKIYLSEIRRLNKAIHEYEQENPLFVSADNKNEDNKITQEEDDSDLIPY